MLTMNRILAGMWTVLVVTAIALPSIGPLIDHHFAERHPAHHHVSVALDHTHGHHVHIHTDNAPIDATALYNYDSGLVTAVPSMIDDAVRRASERFEPTSIFNVPAFARISRADHIPAPPDRPPQPVT